MKESNDEDMVRKPEIIAKEMAETATKLKDLIKESDNSLNIVFVIDGKRYHLEYNPFSRVKFDLEVSFPKCRFTTYTPNL